MSADIRTAYLAQLREGNSSFSPECLEYLFQIIYRSTFQGKVFRDLPAAELCRIFRRQAAADFGAFAPETMERFGLATFEDLGRAVGLLVRLGCLALREGESLEAYAALGAIRFEGSFHG